VSRALLQARCTLAPAERADPFPDRASGWHAIRVNVQ
jgi:hypothetical protein